MMTDAEFIEWLEDEICAYATFAEFKQAVASISERAASGEKFTTEAIAEALGMPLSLLKLAVGQADEMKAHVIVPSRTMQ